MIYGQRSYSLELEARLFLSCIEILSWLYLYQRYVIWFIFHHTTNSSTVMDVCLAGIMLSILWLYAFHSWKLWSVEVFLKLNELIFLLYFRCEWFWKFWIFPFHRDASRIYFFRTIAGRWLWDETHRQSRLTHVQCCYCPVFSLNTRRWKWCLLI